MEATNQQWDKLAWLIDHSALTFGELKYVDECITGVRTMSAATLIRWLTERIPRGEWREEARKRILHERILIDEQGES